MADYYYKGYSRGWTEQRCWSLSGRLSHRLSLLDGTGLDLQGEKEICRRGSLPLRGFAFLSGSLRFCQPDVQTGLLESTPKHPYVSRTRWVPGQINQKSDEGLKFMDFFCVTFISTLRILDVRKKNKFRSILADTEVRSFFSRFCWVRGCYESFSQIFLTECFWSYRVCITQ